MKQVLAESAARQIVGQLREYAKEDRLRSARCALAGVALCTLAHATAAFAPFWPMRLAGSVLAGLMLVRLFIMYHDHMHGALLAHSRIARCFFYMYGLYALNPPSIWRYTHHYHHAHNSRIDGSHIGGFWLMTTTSWAQASFRTRAKYRMVRHPLNIVFAYLSVFLLGMCLASLLASPRRNLDSALSLGLHAAAVAGVAWALGWDTVGFAVVGPLAIASLIGAFFFYIQHAFEGIAILDDSEWSYLNAGLSSTCFIRMGPVLNWISGNIGYHHIHHLNPRIPFYRLPQAMATIEPLQHPKTVELSWRQIRQAFRLKLWDSRRGKMTGFPAG